MKLEFDTIYHAYSNESPFKYYISILGGVRGQMPCLFCLFRGGGPEFGKTYIYIAPFFFVNNDLNVYVNSQLKSSTNI